MEMVVLSGLAVFRWAALVWITLVMAVNWDQFLRPWLALGLIGAAFVYTVAATGWLRSSPAMLRRPEVLGGELVLALTLTLCDGWAYGADHSFSTSQSLGSYWPVVTVLTVGAALGTRWGAGAGALLGLARLGSVLANGVRNFDDGRAFSLVNTTVFSITAGVIAGYLVDLLRRAEREISASRAREEVARTLHDGVLQTLAVIERRSTDQALVRMARDQDRELRRYLFGDTTAADDGVDLGAALRRAASRFESSHGVPAEVLVPDDLPKLDSYQVHAVSGAVTEALTNAGKHAGASRVTVFVEPDGDRGLFCSVKDDGHGFDQGIETTGIGIARSITQRMQEAGGRVEIRSRPGDGTEVCLWL